MLENGGRVDGTVCVMIRQDQFGNDTIADEWCGWMCYEREYIRFDLESQNREWRSKVR